MNQNHTSRLDYLRQNQGMYRLRAVFRDLAAQNRRKAVRYLNDDMLGFPTLYILLPDIEALDLYEELSARNIAAIELCAKKSGNPGLSLRLKGLLPHDGDAVRKALSWMFSTGLYWDGPDKLYDSFDAAMDVAAGLLVRTYGDTAVLPAVAELIFRRNRKGLFIHDLVWSFFQSCEPDALKLIAEYLLSADLRDVRLACRLLHLTLPEGAGAVRRRELYLRYLSWFGENKPYLRFTGECFQQTSEPNPLYVDTEARYLGKRISPRDGKPLEPLSREETECLARFRTVPEQEREILAAYSARIRGRDIRTWEEWLRGPVSEQVGKAKSEWQAAR